MRRTLQVVAEPDEVLLQPEDQLEYAWAMFVRIYARGGASWRKPSTGALRATATELLSARRGALLTADREDWIETLHVAGRAVVRVFLPEVVRIPSDDGHACDCTCAGAPGHARWEERPASWRQANAFEILHRLGCGEPVRVQLLARSA